MCSENTENFATVNEELTWDELIPQRSEGFEASFRCMEEIISRLKASLKRLSAGS